MESQPILGRRQQCVLNKLSHVFTEFLSGITEKKRKEKMMKENKKAEQRTIEP